MGNEEKNLGGVAAGFPLNAPERKLLSHRVHFVSSRQFVEDYTPMVAGSLGISDLDQVSGVLQYFVDCLMRSVGYAFETATAKAINEAIALIQDPDYYETVRNRRRRARARAKADEAEQWERRHNPPKPTLQGIQNELAHIARSVVYHEGALTALATKADGLKQQEAALLLEDSDAEEGVM